MHFIMAVKHIQKGFYAMFIMAHCNALWYYYHTLLSITYITKDYAKNKIFMTFSQY